MDFSILQWMGDQNSCNKTAFWDHTIDNEADSNTTNTKFEIVACNFTNGSSVRTTHPAIYIRTE
jgi:hypothetical protein